MKQFVRPRRHQKVLDIEHREWGSRMRALHAHPEVVAALDQIVPHSSYGPQPSDITFPVLYVNRRAGTVELSWTSAWMMFEFDREGCLRLVDSDVDWWNVRPDGRIMVSV